MIELNTYSGPLTIGLWLLSFLGIAIAFWKTKHWKDMQPNITMNLLRCVFCCLVGLTIWVNLAYAFWLAGFELKIGTVAKGEMQSNAWFPPIVLLWTVFTYFVSKPSVK